MNRVCINLETGDVFAYDVTLQSRYLSGMYGALPLIEYPSEHKERPLEYTHHQFIIKEPAKLAKRLRELADSIDEDIQTYPQPISGIYKHQAKSKTAANLDPPGYRPPSRGTAGGA